MLGRVVLALCLLLAGLAVVTLSALTATRQATDGAREIESEFAERVATERAVLAATENFRLAEQRLRSDDAREADAIAAPLAASDGRLAAAIAVTQRVNGRHDDETAGIAAIRTAYARYVATRNALAERRRPAGAGERLAASFRPLQRTLVAYGGEHYDEARADLRSLEAGSGGRRLHLALGVGLSLLGLVALVVLARGIVVRAREFSVFAGRVAGGDLVTRVTPRGTDELDALGHSLNSMVEQLASASRARGERLAGDAAYRSTQDAFTEVLRVTQNEQAAHALLKLHLERSIPGTAVAVLNRNNSEDRLEPTTPLAEDSPLAGPLASASPRDCLAVRLARPFESGDPMAALAPCRVCGALPARSTCVPLLVGGEVIGSVLLDHPEPLADEERRRLGESVAQAAPTLANLRNLALAEARAATDALTGLPNRRAVQDTLRRMLAHSARTLSPLAVVLLDLDHFKQINDTYGHDEGDAVLAAVGDVLAAGLRASDFVGRSGGEEFIVLLPDTGADAAMGLAEKVRAAVANVTLARVNRAITGSFGVAVHPEHAADAETLVRVADRALYLAKANGRNRVELARPASAEALLERA